MDAIRDHDRFRKLIGRLCETLGKPITDELVESWWKALRHVEFDVVAEKVERFLALADETTRFPRPAQMRPKDQLPVDPNTLSQNPIRDYWRSTIVHELRYWFGMSLAEIERLLINNSDIVRPVLSLLNELETQDRRDGRTIGQHRYVQRVTGDIARSWRQFRLENAPPLPALSHDVPEFA